MTSNGNEPTGKKPPKLSEDDRYTVYRIGAHTAWWGAFTWMISLTIVNVMHDPTLPRTEFQIMSGIGIVFLIGVGIALGSALARMRLADTITSVFEAGLKVATVLQTNVTSSACMLETDPDGVIQAVEHAEVIGWTRDRLVGENLDVLIPDRLLRQHQEGFRTFRESEESRVTGSTVNVPIMTGDGNEQGMRLSIARLGDTFLGTLVPIGEQKTYEVQR